MTRDEMIARAVQMRSRDLFGQVTKEDLAGLEAFQKKIEIPPLCSAKVWGGFSMYGYLQNVKTNVSNATRNRPKAIKSPKSK